MININEYKELKIIKGMLIILIMFKNKIDKYIRRNIVTINLKAFFNISDVFTLNVIIMLNVIKADMK